MLAPCNNCPASRLYPAARPITSRNWNPRAGCGLPFPTPLRKQRGPRYAPSPFWVRTCVAVNLVAVQTVPVLWPLAPDSRTIHLREQLTRIAADVAADVAAESHIPVWPVVVLARDYYAAFARVLGPHSVVLISGSHWFSAESRMARRLRKAGLGVIVTKLA